MNAAKDTRLACSNGSKRLFARVFVMLLDETTLLATSKRQATVVAMKNDKKRLESNGNMISKVSYGGTWMIDTKLPYIYSFFPKKNSILVIYYFENTAPENIYYRLRVPMGQVLCR